MFMLSKDFTTFCCWNTAKVNSPAL